MYENQYPFAPFAQNVNIVKAYFRKPTIIAQAILYIVSILLSIVTIFMMAPAMTEYLDRILSIPEIAADMPVELYQSVKLMPTYLSTIIGIAAVPGIIITALMAVAFFIIHAKSNNDDPNSSPKSGVTILYVLSILQLIPVIIFSIFVLLLVAVMFVLALAMNGDMPDTDAQMLLIVSIIYAIVFGGMITVMLMYAISQIKYYKSIINSLTTVSLTYKGAGMFGVLNILYGIYILMNALSSLATIPLFDALMQSVPETQMLVGIMDPLKPVLILSPIASVVTGAISILSAVIALGYKNHIKSYTDGYAESYAQPQEFAPQTEPYN